MIWSTHKEAFLPVMVPIFNGPACSFIQRTHFSFMSDYLKWYIRHCTLDERNVYYAKHKTSRPKYFPRVTLKSVSQVYTKMFILINLIIIKT